MATETTFGTRTKLTALMADLGSVVRFDPINNNTFSFSFVLDKALQLIERPVANPIVHNSSSLLFTDTFEVFHHNLVSIEIGNNIFTYTVVYVLHPTSFSSRDFHKQPLTGASAFRLKLGTQILELPFYLFDFRRIIKPAVRTDGKVVYSKVNAQNLLRSVVLLSGSNLFRECEDEETPLFSVNHKQAFIRLAPCEIFSVAVGDVNIKTQSFIHGSNNQEVAFEISSSGKVVTDSHLINKRFSGCFEFSLPFLTEIVETGNGCLNHTASLSDTSDSKLRWQSEPFTDIVIDSVMEFEVLSDVVLPCVINAELECFLVNTDSFDYLRIYNNLDFSTDNASHKDSKSEQLYKCCYTRRLQDDNVDSNTAFLPALK